MAGSKIKGINIKIGADTKGLDDALKGIEAKSKSTKTELNEVNRTIKAAPESIKLWEQKQKLLNDAIKESREKVKLLEDAEKQLEEKVKIEEITEEQYRAFQRELEKARSESEKLEGQLAETNGKIRDLGGTADDTSEDMEELGGAEEKAGEKAEKSASSYAVLAGGIAAVSAAAVEAIKTAEEMSQSYDIIVKKTGAVGESLESLKGSARNVFTSIPTDMDNAAIAVGEVNTRFSVTGETLEELSKKFIRFAEINDIDLNNSIGTTSKVMKQWDIDISNIDGLLGILTKKAQDTGISVDSLLSSVQSNGATFKEMGLSLEESINLLAQFEANGVNAETAITGLRKGIKAATDSGKTLEQALDEAVSGIKNAATETEALSKAQELFGTKGAAEMANAILEGRFNLHGLSEDMSLYRDTVIETYEATLSPMERMKTVGNESKIAIAALGDELTKALLPTAEKMLPKIKNGTEWLVDNTPKLINTGKELLPIITGIGAAWATWKVASTATKGAEAVVGFAKAVKSGESAMKLLNLTMLENPAVAVTAAIFGLTAAMVVWHKKQQEEHDIAKKVAEAHREEREAIERTGEQIDQLSRNFRDSAKDIDFESKRVEELWNQLNELTDASGRVKQADKERAQYILGELNDALGTEYRMTGNQIENYQKMQGEIDKLIEKKKASALIDAATAQFPELYKAQSESMSQLQDANLGWYKAKEEKASAAADVEKLFGDTGRTPDQIVAAYNAYGNKAKLYTKSGEAFRVTDEMYTVAQKYLEADEHEQRYAGERNNAKRNFTLATDQINKVNDAMTAFTMGDNEKAISTLYTPTNTYKEELKKFTTFSEEARSAYSDSIRRSLTELDAYIETGDNKLISSALKTMDETVKLAKEKGASNADAFTEPMIASFRELSEKGFDLSGLTKWAKESGVDIAKIFGDNYTDIIQKQLDKGYDVGDLLIWAVNTGNVTAAQYNDVFNRTVQDKLNQGWDIYDLIVWGERSGFEVEESFYSALAAELQRNFSLGFDATDLIKWAQRTGRNIGETLDAAINGVVSMKDPSLWYNTYYMSKNVTKNATGGYISSGNRGIIAEAGPELVEVMNGGVRITPLSGSATNVPVESAGTSVTNYFYNTYNFPNTKFSSSMDIDTVSRELATRQQQLLNAKGLNK